MMVETELSEEEFRKEVAKRIENVIDYERDPNPDQPLPPVESYDSSETPKPDDISPGTPLSVRHHPEFDPHGSKSGKPDNRY